MEGFGESEEKEVEIALWLVTTPTISNKKVIPKLYLYWPIDIFLQVA